MPDHGRCRCGGCRSGGGLGGSEGDGVAELFKLADQPAGLALGVAAALEEVLAKVVEWLPGGEYETGHLRHQ